MNKLKSLREANDLTDIAKLLGFTPKGMSYILYKLDKTKKYRAFFIPKKTGGLRLIKAPDSQLSLLQSRLAELLYECTAAIQADDPRFWRASYGFQKRKTIVSNAEIHRRRYYVFNVDIKDFFNTINFGRVRGFFLKDKSFELTPAVATIIAQIACHENMLPQGSPCSPVISNLIGNILDLRLLALARDTHCTYSRYADDLTFSTNEKQFPSEIAVNVHDSIWVVGKKLREDETAGFELNDKKTRMSLRRSRQTVTGLVVNTKANINQHYYRSVRAMCNAVFQTGEYQRPGHRSAKRTHSLNALDGMLAHINFVKARRDRTHKTNKNAKNAGEFRPPDAPTDLYRKFLFYRYFVAPEGPLIVTEGISDITYLHCAIRSLAKSFPALAAMKHGKFNSRLVHFLKPSGITRDILNLGHGASGQAALIGRYSNNLKRYGHKPLQHPVIILCDNDGGPKTVFKAASDKSGTVISINTTDPFYFLGENLYLVKVPEGAPPAAKEIEHLFKSELLDEKINGKPLDLKKDHGDESAYGKVVFAEKVVRPKAGKIDFTDFAELLGRIELCINDYKIKSSASVTATPPMAVSA